MILDIPGSRSAGINDRHSGSDTDVCGIPWMHFLGQILAGMEILNGLTTRQPAEIIMSLQEIFMSLSEYLGDINGYYRKYICH